MGQRELKFINVIGCLTLVFGVFMIIKAFSGTQVGTSELTQNNDVISLQNMKFGFNSANHIFEEYELSRDQTLGDILLTQGIQWDSILRLDEISTSVFSIRNFRANKPFTIVKKDSCSSPLCVIYEPNRLSYVKYDVDSNIQAELIKRNYELCVESATGVIESSLWLAMNNAGISVELIDQMEDALAAGVDFYHTQKGDQFKLIYESKAIEGKDVGHGRLLAAGFQNVNGETQGFYYENERYKGYYDAEGHPTKRSFLRAPVKYSRISSRFNRNRLHPIKKRRIPHLGTDYAAPIGTPIFAVADGVIEVAGFAKNNGKYVKIKHDDVHKTQYLHMNGYAPGIKRGVSVKQGQTIGYVGQTGLATGPHVCFRFWKNGKQVNHLRENFAPKDPLPTDEIPQFNRAIKELRLKLKSLRYPNDKSLTSERIRISSLKEG